MRSCEHSYPGHRRRGGLQRGAGLTVNEAQFDETTHGLGESLVDRKIQKKKKSLRDSLRQFCGRTAFMTC